MARARRWWRQIISCWTRGGRVDSNYPDHHQDCQTPHQPNSEASVEEPTDSEQAKSETLRTEVKVFVQGFPRVVCGLTEETTCQDVVTDLAKDLGQDGRYILQERFKDVERCMLPTECIVETLRKYGEQAKEVRLTLVHVGPCVGDEMSRANVGRHQPCPPLRRKEAGARIRLGISSLSFHRRSLLPLTDSKQESSQELKKPKRKSLTFMEEARLESMGKTRVYSTVPEKQSKRGERKNRSFEGIFLEGDQDNSEQIRGQRNSESDLDQQTSCFMGSQAKIRDEEELQKPVHDLERSSSEEKLDHLRDTIVKQLGHLQGLRLQMSKNDLEIAQCDCRSLEEYKQQMNSLRSSSVQEEQSVSSEEARSPDNPHRSDLRLDVNIHRKLPPRETVTPSAAVPPRQIRERRRTSPSQLRDTIVKQLVHLQGLRLQMAKNDLEIAQFEARRAARRSEEDNQQMIEELEQLKFRENELKTEVCLEGDLQNQFLEIKSKAGDCKSELEEYKKRINSLRSSSVQEEESVSSEEARSPDNPHKSDLRLDVNIHRKLPPRETVTPSAAVPPSQIIKQQPTSPSQLREWWERWAEAQSPKIRLSGARS